MIEIIDYENKYLNEIDKLDKQYWGNEDENYENTINNNSIIKLARLNGNLIGLIHCQKVGDLLDVYHLLIQIEHQNKGVGSMLMDVMMQEANKLNIKNSIARAVINGDGHINARNILIKFGYKEMYRVNNY